MTDLPTLAFLALRQRFFNDQGHPQPFNLRDKGNTQDDPLDEFLVQTVLTDLAGVTCSPAPGPLISPDMVLHTPNVSRSDDLTQIVGIEVKKIERTARGGVARSTGLDFNTTPPCGRILVYDVGAEPIEIRGFYLFICLEPRPHPGNDMIVSAFALVDGNLLNEDFGLYLSVIGERTKQIELGTFGDGADRKRPMLIFGNPLGIKELDHSATLIHPSHDLADSSPDLVPAYVLRRTVTENEHRDFCCYRDIRDFRSDVVRTLIDPFQTPARDPKTRPRGRFVLPFKMA